MSEVAARAPDGKFLSGQSGNPDGRPTGTRNQTTMVKEYIEYALTHELKDDAVAILRVAILKAKQGDNAMIKFLLGDILSEVRREATGSKGNGAVVVTVNNMTEGPTSVTIEQKDEDEQAI